MPDPLKLSREIAAEVLRCRASATIHEVAAKMLERAVAERIDARVRPLVDALVRIELIARNYVQTGSDKQRPLFWEIHDIATKAIAISDPPEGDE